MKKLLVSTIIALPTLAWAQGGDYIINGKIGKLNAPAKAYLSRRTGGADVIDSTVIKNGVFKFTGKVDNISPATITINHNGKGLSPLGIDHDTKLIYLEKGTIKVVSKDSVARAVISGSPINKEAYAYELSIKPAEDALLAVSNEFGDAPPEKKGDGEFVKGLREKWNKISEEKRVLQKKYISQHPDSYFSLAALREVAGNSPEVAEIEPIYNGLSEKLRTSNTGKEFLTFLDNHRKTSMGAIAPEFKQNDVNDKPVNLSDFRGKYVLIDFWAAWCGPCRGENPNLIMAYNSFRDKNFTILGVSLDEKKEDWLKAIENDRLPWTQVSDLKGWNNQVSKLYGVRSIPQNFLLDPTGKIVGKNLRGEDLEKKLREIIK